MATNAWWRRPSASALARPPHPLTIAAKTEAHWTLPGLTGTPRQLPAGLARGNAAITARNALGAAFAASPACSCIGGPIPHSWRLAHLVGYIWG